MEKKIIIVEGGNQMVEMLKTITSAEMTGMEQLLLQVELPQREEYETEEEYKEDYKQFMLDMIDTIKDAKKGIFCNVLDAYNEFLYSKNDMDNRINTQNRESIEMMETAGRDIRNTGIATVVLSILLPSAIPIILVFSVTRASLDFLQSVFNTKRMLRNEQIREEMKNIQIPFFEFTCDLRSDYHKSNHELDALKEKALNGENIMGELIQIVSPERVSLQRVEGLNLLEMDEEEKPKQLIKKDNK